MSERGDRAGGRGRDGDRDGSGGKEGDGSRDRRSRVALLGDPALVSVLLVAVVGVVGFAAISPTLASLGGALGVPDGRLGLLMTAFYAAAMVAVPVAGAGIDVFGRRRLVIGALVLFGLAGTASALAAGFTTLLVLRGFQGLAFAALLPLTVALVGDLYTGAAGATAQGLRSAAIGVAMMVVPAVAGWLAGRDWRLPFLLFALAFPAALVVYRYYPETVPAAETTDTRGRVERARSYVRAVSRELEPSVAVLVVGGFVTFAARQAVVTFGPLFAARALGAGPVVAGAVVSVVGAGRIVAAPLAGDVVSRLSRKTVLVGTNVVAALCFGVVAVVRAVVPVFVALAVYAVALALLFPTLNGALNDLVSDERRGGVVSLLNVGKTGANALAPAVLGGVLALSGYRGLFLVSAGLSVLYALVLAAVFAPGLGPE